MKIFNYSTFETRLEKMTRTLHVSFFDKEFGTLEGLFELESLLSWCQNRLEINSLSISSQGERFNLNFENENMGSLKSSYLEKVYQKTFKLAFQLMNLPQTIIFDLGKNPHPFVFQVSLGADMRLAQKKQSFMTSPLSFGLSPASGILSLSNELFGKAFTKKIFMGKEILSDRLETMGVVETYEEKERAQKIYEELLAIGKQAPIPRIQAKLSMSLMTQENIKEMQKIEEKTFQAAKLAEDWKNYLADEFTPAQHMAYILQYLEKSNINATC